MKFPKAQPKPLSPCDDCLVTIRGDKGPAVRFGNQTNDDLPVFDEIEEIIAKEQIREENIHWTRLVPQIVLDRSKKEKLRGEL